MKSMKRETILHHNGRENGYPMNGIQAQQNVPRINDIIGRALSRIGPYKKLDNTKQVVALIDDVNILLFIVLFYFFRVYLFRICALTAVNVT